jgi:hypothetical protein
LGNDTIGVQALLRAAEIVGGTHALASRLRVPHRKLLDWLDGPEQAPWEVSLRVVEIVVPPLLAELFARSKRLSL